METYAQITEMSQTAWLSNKDAASRVLISSAMKRARSEGLYPEFPYKWRCQATLIFREDGKTAYQVGVYGPVSRRRPE